MHPLFDHVADETGSGCGGRLLSLGQCRCAFCVGLKVTMMQLTNANGEFVAAKPHSDVTNFCVSRRDGDNWRASEL
jgi:hypothetical protein